MGYFAAGHPLYIAIVFWPLNKTINEQNRKGEGSSKNDLHLRKMKKKEKKK